MVKPTDKVEVFGIFPTPIYLASWEEVDPEIIALLDAVEIDYSKCDTSKATYGQISLDTYVLDRPEFAKLQDFILKHVKHFAKEVLAYQFTDMVLTQSWISVKEPGQQHVFHRHPNSIISGSFYWQEGDITPLSFEKADRGVNIELTKDFNNVSDYACDFYVVKPKRYTLALFPSDLMHGVKENNNDVARKSLAFNTMVTDILGVRDNLTELDFTRLNKRQSARKQQS